jgi:hypothetical protein
MIVVSTSGPGVKVAQVLRGYAKTFLGSMSPNGVLPLPPPLPDAVAIAQALSAHPGRSFYFFGHGGPPQQYGFLGNCGNPAVEPSTVALLAKRVVAAVCCYGEWVSNYAKAHQFEMVGYTGPLHVPLTSPYIAQMEPAALAGPRHLRSGGNAQGAAGVSRNEYAKLAQRLHSGSARDRFAATVIAANASAVTSW